MLGNAARKRQRVKRRGHQQFLATLKSQPYVDGNLGEEIEILLVRALFW